MRIVSAESNFETFSLNRFEAISSKRLLTEALKNYITRHFCVISVNVNLSLLIAAQLSIINGKISSVAPKCKFRGEE